MKHYTESELRKLLKFKVEQWTLTSIAKGYCYSPSFISDVLAGRRPIGRRLAAALGYEKLEGCYTRKKGA